ncbi:hypothetical protein [Burkholderia glumae]|uniref:hypothetical protein n=1 Tax=Burkholderia glumae TaxID=337 RepID=UPI000401E812|nr:hypothetical protein [Burkholderia glumae]QKM57758.1 hypothetical protein CG017_05838 [Burkholderia glumae]
MKFNPDYLFLIALVGAFSGLYIFFVKSLFSNGPRGYIKIMWAFLTMLMCAIGIALLVGADPFDITFVCLFSIAGALALTIFIGLRRGDIYAEWRRRDIHVFLDEMHEDWHTNNIGNPNSLYNRLRN